MWIRNTETGEAEFVIDPAAAVAMVVAGNAEPIDDLPQIEPEKPKAKAKK